jgi:hypothetical protein
MGWPLRGLRGKYKKDNRIHPKNIYIIKFAVVLAKVSGKGN